MVNSTDVTAENFFSVLIKRFKEEQKQEHLSTLNSQEHKAPNASSPLPTILRTQNQLLEKIVNKSIPIAKKVPPSTSTVSSTTDSTQQNAMSYVDDEDMGNDYLNEEASGLRPLWNDTSAYSIINGNDVSD